MVVYAGKRYKTAYKREPKLKLQEWAEKKIIFTSEDVSPMLGNFKTKNSPHYVKLFQLAERLKTREMFAKWASQSGKSLFGMILASEKLDQNPATIIYAIPTKDQATDILTLKVNPVLQSIPTLWKKFEDYANLEKFRTKDAIKRVPGGALVVKGALTAKDRKSLSSPRIIMDEIGEFEKGAVAEFSERTKAFSRFYPLVVGLSTIVAPDDEICTNHDACEVFIEWHFICQECGENFYPSDSTLKIPSVKEFSEYAQIKEDEVDNSEYTNYAKTNIHIECPHCKHKIYEKEREKMIFNNGMDWFRKVSNSEYILFNVEDLKEEETFGIDMNTLGSYFATLQDIAREYVKAITSEDKETKLDIFYRGWLNKFYKSELDKGIETTDVALLNSEYEEFVVPDDTAAIYIGTDTQKGYYWTTIVAFRYGMSPHLMWAGRVEDEDTIETFMDRKYYYKDGTPYHRGIQRAGQDWQGYREYKEEINESTGEVVQETVMDMPQRVKEFAFKMADKYGADKDGRERYYATRGEEFLSNDDFFRFANLEVESKNYKDSRKIKTLKLGTVALKSAFMSTLIRSIAKAKALEGDDEFEYENRLFSINKTQCNNLLSREKIRNKDIDMQLTSETYGYGKTPSGKPKQYKSWNKIRNDNHYLDCMVICYALAIMDNIQSLKKPKKETKQTSAKDIIKDLL
jgi:phage terminase large subunit GpA-like protein